MVIKKTKNKIFLYVCIFAVLFVTVQFHETNAATGGNSGTIHSGARVTPSPVGAMGGSQIRTDYVNPDGTTATRYTDNSGGGSVGGGGGNNVPNCSNSFSEWCMFTKNVPQTIAARGDLQTVVSNARNCKVQGWALDGDEPNTSIEVHVYKDAPAGSGTFIMSCPTNILNAGVNSANGVSGDHGFDCALPASYMDGGSHRIFIHAIDVNGSPNNQLSNNGKWLSCAPPVVYMSASDCVIPQNRSTCKTNMYYSFNSVPAPRQVWDLTTGVLIANATVAATASFSRDIGPGTHTMVAQGNSYAADSGIRYAYAYPTASCAAGTTWDGKACKAAAFGSFDSVDQNSCSIAGWAIDMDSPSQSIDVHVYKDNSGFSGGTFVTSCRANTTRADVNAYLGVSGRHGFSCTLPATYLNTGNHNLYIHAIDLNGTPNNLISGTPRSLSCNATAVVTATNCVIPVNGTSCNTTINWQFTNAPNAPTCSSRQIYGVNQTTGATTLFSNCTNPGVNVSKALRYGTHKVSARYNGTEIAVTPVITASCAAPSAWDGTKCLPPPTITFSAAITQFPGFGVPVTTTLTAPSTALIAPGAKIDLTWTSTNASSCTTNFGSSAKNGTITIASYTGATSYSITCTNIAGTVTKAIGASVPQFTLTFDTAKKLLRRGEATTLSWKVELENSLSGVAGIVPYPLTCTINGGGTHTFSANTHPTGSITSLPIHNNTLTTLTCVNAIISSNLGMNNPASVEIESVPQAEEI